MVIRPVQLLSRINGRSWSWVAFGMAALALAVAYISEYGFGLHPCQMCYWQRIPYAIVLLLGLLAWYVPHVRLRYGLLWGAVVILAIGGVLGAFHAGVEWQWWEGPTTCSGGVDATASVQDILAQLKAAATVSCTEPAIRVWGLSMAGWNAVYGIGCAAMLAMGLIGRKEQLHGI